MNPMIVFVYSIYTFWFTLRAESCLILFVISLYAYILFIFPDKILAWSNIEFWDKMITF